MVCFDNRYFHFEVRSGLRDAFIGIVLGEFDDEEMLIRARDVVVLREMTVSVET